MATASSSMVDESLTGELRVPPTRFLVGDAPRLGEFEPALESLLGKGLPIGDTFTEEVSPKLGNGEFGMSDWSGSKLRGDLGGLARCREPSHDLERDAAEPNALLCFKGKGFESVSVRDDDTMRLFSTPASGPADFVAASKLTEGARDILLSDTALPTRTIEALRENFPAAFAVVLATLLSRLKRPAVSAFGLKYGPSFRRASIISASFVCVQPQGDHLEAQRCDNQSV